LDAATTAIRTSPARAGVVPDVAGAIAATAAVLGDATDLDELLHVLASSTCRVLGISRCAIYLRDGEVGPFRGRVAHPPRRRDAEAWMQRSIAGIAADRFTQEILTTRRPVLITDARQDPRCVRRAMVRWDIHAMLGTPMLLRGQVIGLMFLDNGDTAYNYSPEVQQVAAALAEIGAVGLDRVRELERTRQTARAVGRQNRLLRGAAMIDDELRGHLAASGDLADLLESLARLTGKPCAIYDSELTALASHPPGLDTRLIPRARAALATLRDGDPTIVGPFPAHGVHRRVLATRAGEDFIVFLERERELTDLDTVAARRAAAALTVLLRARRRAAATERDSREALIRDLLDGSDGAASLARRACLHHLALDAPRVVCLLAHPRLTSAHVERAWRAVGREAPPLCVEVPGGVMILLGLGTDHSPGGGIGHAKQTAAGVAQALSWADGVTVAISAPCRTAEDYPAAARECEGLLGARAAASPAPGIPAAATDLGAARLLLSPAVAAEAQRFAQEVLGPLLDGSPPSATLLATLVVFLDTNRNVRESGRRLGVHENTVRHRLRRAGRLTGLDLLAGAGDMLSTELAVLVLRRRRLLPV
jgi:hypothetical protein